MFIFAIRTKNNKIIICKNLEASFFLSKLVLTSPFVKGGCICPSMPPSEQWGSIIIEVQLTHCKRGLRQLRSGRPAAPPLAIWAVWLQCTRPAPAWHTGALLWWVVPDEEGRRRLPVLLEMKNGPSPVPQLWLDISSLSKRSVRAGTQEGSR